MPDLCPQHPALPGVGVLPDDGAEGHREAGRLAQDLPHLHAERHHRQPGLLHLPALQSRGLPRLRPTAAGNPSRRLLVTSPPVSCLSGGPCWQPVRDPGLPVRGALPKLAHPGAAVAGLRQTAGHLRLLLLLWPAALDRQLCAHLWLRVWALPLLRLPALHQVCLLLLLIGAFTKQKLGAH